LRGSGLCANRREKEFLDRIGGSQPLIELTSVEFCKQCVIFHCHPSVNIFIGVLDGLVEARPPITDSKK
jgi:uncharacterized cupin superfamily protein